MIYNKNIAIRVHTKNKKKYPNNNIGDIISINIEELSLGSNVKIEAKCDNNKCSTKKLIPYFDYNKATKNQTREYYCKKCSHLHTKKTLLDKYGVDNVMKIDSIKEKHHKNVLSIDTIKSNNKRKETNLEKYGVEYLQQNKNINNKTKETNLEKYGVEYIYQTEENIKKGRERNSNLDVINKRKKTHHKNIISKINNRYDINIIEYNGTEFIIECPTCIKNYTIDDTLLYNRHRKNTRLCTICNPKTKKESDSELLLREFLLSLDIDFIENDRIILNGKELDIYIPELNLAIEFNGLYWHSELYKDKNYHLDKTIECGNKGVQLLHIFEDDWNYKREIIESIIRNKLGKIKNKIYARKTEIREVKSNIAREFLDMNHIQGFSTSTYKLGLYYDNELVSLMTFGYRKTNSKKEFELIRFCNKLDWNVIGASSKLFKYFLKNYSDNIDESYILSYTDISLFDGQMYDTLGFDEIHLTVPNYFWVVNKKREHRWKYNKQKLIKEGYSKDLTEVEIMHSRNYYRIYGCGQKRYEYNIKK